MHSGSISILGLEVFQTKGSLNEKERTQEIPIEVAASAQIDLSKKAALVYIYQDALRLQMFIHKPTGRS